VTLPWDELKPEPPPPPPPNLPDVIIPSQPVQLDLGKILTDALAQVLQRTQAPGDPGLQRRPKMEVNKGAVAKIIDTLIGWLPDKTQAKIQGSRKAVVAGIGALLTVLTFVSDKFHFLIPPAYAEPIAAVIAFLTTVLTYTTPNQLPDVDESGA
jgi:hypothetical protein